MSPAYKSVIFTNHAWQRLSERTITADMAVTTIEHPDKKYQEASTTKFIKTISGRKVHVVANQDHKTGQWVVVSSWVRGEADKVPLSWQLLTAPFRVLWWILTTILKLVLPNQRAKR